MHAGLKRAACLAVAIVVTCSAHAGVGLTEIDVTDTTVPVTVFYPTQAVGTRVEKGRVALDVARNAAPSRGNGKLIVMSHGSGGWPWDYADLVRVLVEAGFVVALPWHAGDNARDGGDAGPRSWKRRPAEVSQAIDAIERDVRFGPTLAMTQVGMYGMSAGGHTALTLAGGRWSPAQLHRHCNEHIAEDYQSCAGPSSPLSGGFWDGPRKRVILFAHRFVLSDETWYAHTDPRITAIVASVPVAADFDMASLAKPRVALGIVRAGRDIWLVPRFHSDAVLQVCGTCERVMDIENGGHGALLSPLPELSSGPVPALIADPAGFDRARVVPQVNAAIAGFFLKHLVEAR